MFNDWFRRSADFLGHGIPVVYHQAYADVISSTPLASGTIETTKAIAKQSSFGETRPTPRGSVSGALRPTDVEPESRPLLEGEIKQEAEAPGGSEVGSASEALAVPLGGFAQPPPAAGGQGVIVKATPTAAADPTSGALPHG